MTTTIAAPVAHLHPGAIVEYRGSQRASHGLYLLESPCTRPDCIAVDYAAKFQIPFVEHTHFRLAAAFELDSPAQVLNHVRSESFRLVHYGPDRATCEVAPFGPHCGAPAVARLIWTTRRGEQVRHVCQFHRMSTFNDLVDAGHTPEWVDIP
jgi:hypothetical protein